MKKVIINLVTHSSYKDICENFVQLFDKNWACCTYDFCISVIGEETVFPKKKNIYLGKNCTLPEAIYRLMNNSEYDYCISFLGDAFISQKINNKEIEKLIKELSDNNIEYCNLIPRVPYRFHKEKLNKNLRYISTNDSYNMSFVAFIANKEFILNEFKDSITDLDFEMKYLNRGNGCKKYYKNRVILTNNIFKIVPGICAGKWDRHALKKLKKNNPEIEFSNRKLMSRSSMMKNDLILIFQIFASQKQRVILKKIISKITGIKFATDF